jgi:hypothetical protein
MTARVRHRRVSDERIIKLMALAKARGLSVAIKLGTDGSAVLTDAADLGATSEPEEDAVGAWDRALGIQ